jgi:hypothetical protein
MWYVFGATGVALAGIGNGTLKRGTQANRLTSSCATPGAARSKTPGSAAPAAAPAPIPRNSFLDIRLLDIADLLSFKNGKTGHPFGVAGCTTGSTRP